MSELPHIYLAGDNNIVETITRLIRDLLPVVGEFSEVTGDDAESDIPPVKRRLYVDVKRVVRKR